MLLIDGVKYELWTPPSEDEFEQVVNEHTQEIFGEQSVYFDRKHKLRSLSGIGSIPDGYAVVPGDSSHWHIVEVELSSHPLHEHIVSQVSKFINGIKNPNTQREITGAIYGEITRDGFLKLKVEQAIGSGEVYKFLSDLMAKPPILTIIIEKDTEGLREAVATLAHPQIKVVEFDTFRREGAEAVHAHLFEPLYTVAEEPVPPVDRKYVNLRRVINAQIKWHYFEFDKKDRSFFPRFKVPFLLEADGSEVQTAVVGAKKGTPEGDPDAGYYIQRNLGEWVKRHPELKAGDMLRIIVVEPMKRYRLEIVK